MFRFPVFPVHVLGLGFRTGCSPAVGTRPTERRLQGQTPRTCHSEVQTLPRRQHKQDGQMERRKHEEATDQAERFLTAVRTGELDTVKEVLSERRELVTCTDHLGRTACHTASEHGHVDVLEYLTRECQCDPFGRDASGVTPLHLASRNGHLGVVRWLSPLAECDFSSQDASGRTPLHYASESGNVELCRYLLSEQGLDPSCKDASGVTPLHIASQAGEVGVVCCIAGDPRCHADSRDNEGRTPLHSSCLSGHWEVVDILRDIIDPSCEDVNGFTPLHLAVRGGDSVVVRLLLGRKCDPLHRSKDGTSSLGIAMVENDLDIAHIFAKKILDSDVSLEAMKKDEMVFLWEGLVSAECLCYEVYEECVDGDRVYSLLKYLISVHGVELSFLFKESASPLNVAASRGWLAVCQWLIDLLSFDPKCPDSQGNTALHLACDFPNYGCNEVVFYLVCNCQCDPLCKNAQDHTPFGLALETCDGKGKIVDFLTQCIVLGEQSIDSSFINEVEHLVTQVFCYESELVLHFNSDHERMIAQLLVRFTDGKSLASTKLCVPRWLKLPPNFLSVGRLVARLGVLHVAAARGWVEICTLLTNQFTIMPECVDSCGNTPLHYAAVTGHLPVVKYLACEKKVNLALKNESGRTALQLACQVGHLDIVKCLIGEAHFEPNSITENGSSLLHLACQNGRIEVAKYLVVEVLCDPNCGTQSSTTPLHLACRNGHLEVVRYL